MERAQSMLGDSLCIYAQRYRRHRVLRRLLYVIIIIKAIELTTIRAWRRYRARQVFEPVLDSFRLVSLS